MALELPGAANLGPKVLCDARGRDMQILPGFDYVLEPTFGTSQSASVPEISLGLFETVVCVCLGRRGRLREDREGSLLVRRGTRHGRGGVFLVVAYAGTEEKVEMLS